MTLAEEDLLNNGIVTGGADSYPRETVSERSARVHLAARLEREARTRVTAQTGSAQGIYTLNTDHTSLVGWLVFI